MINLVFKDCLVKIRKAFQEGKLAFQQGLSVEACEYRNDQGFSCAIGACMTKEELDLLQKPIDGYEDPNTTGLNFLILYGIVSVDQEASALCRLQQLQDGGKIEAFESQLYELCEQHNV